MKGLFVINEGGRWFTFTLCRAGLVRIWFGINAHMSVAFYLRWGKYRRAGDRLPFRVQIRAS
jgi:hypothetical protein